jgi:hypothetical protein
MILARDGLKFTSGDFGRSGVRKARAGRSRQRFKFQ